MNVYRLNLVLEQRVVIVVADDPPGAIELSNQYFDGDVDWSGADVLQIDSSGSTDLEGWRYVVHISVTNAPDLVAEVIGELGDRLDDVGLKLVARLNAIPGITTANYDSTQKSLAVGGADLLGDRHVRMDIFAPGSASGIVAQENGQFVELVTHGGVASDALLIKFPGAVDPGDLEGWIFTVRVSGQEPASWTASDTNTFNEVLETIATILNQFDAISSATWDADARVLTVAGTDDALGDQTVEIDIYRAGESIDYSAQMVESIQHRGSSGSALLITFTEPPISQIPRLYQI